jgi:hypothetical protein
MRHDQHVSDAALPAPAELAAEIMLELDGYNLGLWEIAWMLNHEHPNTDTTARVTLARVVVFDLLDRHAIGLWQMNDWPPTAYEPLTQDETDQLRRDDLPWFDPENAAILVEIRPNLDSSG